MSSHRPFPEGSLRERKRRASAEADILTLRPALGNRYEIRRRLAGGGMSAVFEAWDAQLERSVAIKRLAPELVGDIRALERFWREIRASATLSHPNLVETFDAGQDEQGPFLVMELVEGSTLAAVLRQRGRLPDLEAVWVARGVAAGLHHLHRHGLVHRDVKPGNILVRWDGEAKLTDLGIHQCLGQPDDLATPKAVLGTPSYFSPEQAAGEETTPASDIYGLGLVLYETLTGRLPFQAETAFEMAVAHLHQLPPPPSSFAPVAVALEAVILRALEKDPRRRFVSAQEVADILDCWISSSWRAEGATAPTLRPCLAIA